MAKKGAAFYKIKQTRINEERAHTGQEGKTFYSILRRSLSPSICV